MQETLRLCNQLEKQIPPPFVTTKTKKKVKRKVVLEWSNLLDNSKYTNSAQILKNEIPLLNGFIERKGIQLRLEKALLLTKQTYKIAQRWMGNELVSQIQEFQKSIGNFDDGSQEADGQIIEKVNYKENLRLPSQQWSAWIIYLILRDSALLAKIKIQCQDTVKYWLGLISSSHHWTDSLVITGILSRIWHVSSIMLQDLIDLIYPTILQISQSLIPNNSGPWPNESFALPSSLKDWLSKDMRIKFSPAIIRKNTEQIEKLVGKVKSNTESDTKDICALIYKIF